MRRSHLALWFGVLVVLAFLPCARAQAPAAQTSPGAPAAAAAGVDSAFQKFWAATSPAQAEQLTAVIEKTGVTFDEALRLLKQGRTYSPQPTGVIQLRNQTEDGVEHFFAINVPLSYDPSRRYQVRFQLHGGIGGRSDNKPRGDGAIGALAGAEQIYVLPYAWDEEPWWSDDEVLNLETILDSLKRTYNVDENRVALAGVSDGGTGTYYIAMRDTTPFASFLPLNGFIMVLSDNSIDDGRIFPNNLRDKPLFVVNGGRDRLYPTATVEPFTRHLMASGVAIDYHPQPDGQHNTKWWPVIEDLFEAFVTGHPRNPQPDHLTWEAADLVHNRAHWLLIDSFGAAAGQAKEIADVNRVTLGEAEGPMFGELKSRGRVDLDRSGNTVRATTKGVTAFTLLLSPDVFDFDQPITVVANGREVFHARVERSLNTLLKWAARDNDRTMLYAAEVHIKLAQ